MLLSFFIKSAFSTGPDPTGYNIEIRGARRSVFSGQNADTELDEAAARGRVLITERRESLHRAHDRIMGYRAVFVEPLPAIAMSLAFEYGYDAGPIETGSAVIAVLRVRQVDPRMYDTVTNVR